jgi:elongation factor 1-alpha
MKPGQKLIFQPSNKTGEVKSIEMHHEEIPQAIPGDNVGVNVRGLAKNDIHRGDVAGPTESPPTVVKFEEIQKKLDPKSGEVKEENPDFIKTGDIAIVKIRPTRPMVIERAKDIPQLGRFAVRDMGQTVAAGMCIDLEKKQM